LILDAGRGLRSAAGGRDEETFSKYAKAYEQNSIRAGGSTKNADILFEYPGLELTMKRISEKR